MVTISRSPTNCTLRDSTPTNFVFCVPLSPSALDVTTVSLPTVSALPDATRA